MRQACWEAEHVSADSDGFVPVSSAALEKFQRDLNSLRTIVDELSVGYFVFFSLVSNLNVNLLLKIAPSRVYLYEAVCRLMAGASPGPTQQLLDRSLRHRHTKSSLICGGKGKKRLLFIVMNLND